MKTEKSSDGKGHFWEVKHSSINKFFKGDTGDYDTIRSKLRNFDFFVQDPTTTNGSMINNAAVKTEKLLMDTTSQINSSGAMMPNEYRGSLPTIREESSKILGNATPLPSIEITKPSPAINVNSENQLENTPSPINNFETIDANTNFNMSLNISNRINSEDKSKSQDNYLDPPYLMQRFHTTIGLQTLPGVNNSPHRLRDFAQSNELFNNGNSSYSSSVSNILKSPTDLKRYTCSFNSNFEVSPGSNNYTRFSSNISSSPLNIDGGQSPSGLQDSISKLQRTPEPNKNLEKTPSRFITTPLDSNSILKKSQTPSHLFEDLYSSPIFKAMGTPGGVNIMKPFSPRNFSSPNSRDDVTRGSFSTSRLFGVDVYSVWKRATEGTSKKADETEKDKDVGKSTKDTKDVGKLDFPFNSNRRSAGG